jgi:hypothetical protein
MAIVDSGLINIFNYNNNGILKTSFKIKIKEFSEQKIINVFIAGINKNFLCK